MPEKINHPPHYGGAYNPYEAIKVIEAWGLGFCLGNTLKYISRAGKKSYVLSDLKKARWYLDREIWNQEMAHNAATLSTFGTKSAGKRAARQLGPRRTASRKLKSAAP